MRSGSITVKGNAGKGIGFSMNDGKIIIEGGAEGKIGTCSKGGEIHLNGEYYGLFLPLGKARIYHNGELILYR